MRGLQKEGLGLRVIGFRVSTSMGIWVVVKFMVPFWIPIIIRHLIFI